MTKSDDDAPLDPAAPAGDGRDAAGSATQAVGPDARSSVPAAAPERVARDGERRVPMPSLARTGRTGG